MEAQAHELSANTLGMEARPLAAWSTYAVRLVLAGAGLAALVYAIVEVQKVHSRAACLPSNSRADAISTASWKGALLTATGSLLLFTALVFSDLARSPLLLSVIVMFVALQCLAVYVRISWGLSRGTWSKHAMARGCQPFGAHTVACTGCGMPSERLSDADLDTGTAIHWRCRHCGAANTVGPFEFSRTDSTDAGATSADAASCLTRASTATNRGKKQ